MGLPDSGVENDAGEVSSPIGVGEDKHQNPSPLFEPALVNQELTLKPKRPKTICVVADGVAIDSARRILSDGGT